ncbi:family 43 glycosylhydrolase [Cryobacterium tepidiphilum]|uniref:Arabinan endo-1,5-alpha-L-arabinosidase n=1 Tax=Cryobacterium tepidiphilum TaxID=2486026 RepID=A0A3M8LLY5_9MICO|nr:family 43 glycosylhydrolase [Cryobacterium tepidiphilum]RNE66523.1 arabinan endo-1,5-alpha-L-arabinosidase [Cryobacterium tepidiphilum]
MTSRRLALFTAVLVAGALAIPTTAFGSPPTAGASSVAPAYQNPLDLELPDGGQAASCADPSVIHGQASGDTHWYLYCTSDALTETERDAAGALVQHSVPTFQSTDLIHWTYVGDAFPTKPDWVKPTGGIWAPEVIYRDGQYRLYFAASETTLAGGGSAVGVATSDSPTGPWNYDYDPVVLPDDAGHWKFDPHVVTTADASYLYYGSYFGGIFARVLSDDGLSTDPATEQQIAIDNRYEGTYIVEHDGWFYFFGSATNCCNGPLTGYATFVARSRSPLGPFLDRDGVSILDPHVGGTPVLTQNGNRWVGTGHNTVITDASGQDWIVYHAVDRTDPYYSGDVGYTKRPALIDPLDWRNGWPVVRGGQGPSDEPVPGPAAQPGQQTAYEPSFAPGRSGELRPGHRIAGLSDEFSGNRLSDQWTWVREPGAGEYDLSHGKLVWDTQAADLHPPATPLASVLTEPAPDGDYVVEAKVSMDTPEGCCFNYVQGGLVVYGDDGNYVKLASVSIWNTKQTEFGKNVQPVPEGYPSYGNTVGGPVGEDWAYLRIVHRAQGDTDLYTAFTSIDGHTWRESGTWTHALGDARIGLVSMGGAGFTSTFDYVRVSALKD